MNSVACPICYGSHAKLIYSDYPGYVDGTKFEIFSCGECCTRFIAPLKADKKLYDMIYSSFETPGYDRYWLYAQQIKSEPDPLKFLSESEPTFFPILEFMNGRSRLKILEIGCSYGYLAYAVKKMGNDVFAIDISESAIKFAKENFGNFFEACDIETFTKSHKDKFDLIIATEVIEHVNEPNSFLEKCVGMLENGGTIIFTTPNRDYSPENSVWQTDPPPLHTFWFSKKSFEALAKNFNLDVDFMDFSKYSPKKENKLAAYLLSRKEIIPQPILTFDGKPNRARVTPYSSFYWNIVRKLLLFYPSRIISNRIHDFLRKDYRTLGVVMRKN